MFHASLTSTYLGILGFSVLVAGVDFVRRRAGNRVLETQPASTSPDPQPEIAGVLMTPAAATQTVAPKGGIAYLPDFNRAAPSLPLAGYLALPKPNPGVPRNREYVPEFASWPGKPGVKS